MTRPVVLVAGSAALFAAWTTVAALAADDADPWPTLGVLAVTMVALLVGATARRDATPVIALVVCGVIALTVLGSPNALSRAPRADPLGYSNANGALYVQVAALAGLAATRAATSWARTLFGVICVAFACLPFAEGSVAAAAGGIVVVAATFAGLTGRLRSTGPACWAAGALLVAVLAGTVVLSGQSNGLADDDVGQGRVVSALSERRLELWHDAVSISRDHPVAGVGPGRFSTVSPVARHNPDTRAAHSALLEVSAEEGVPAAAALLALMLVTLAQLRTRTVAAAAPSLVAVAAWAAFCVHSCVDYVADYAAVTAMAGLAVGLGLPDRLIRSTPRLRHRLPRSPESSG